MGNNDWLDIEILDDYLEGKLDASMMHKVERISLEDPFVAQALEGLTAAKKRTQTFSILQKQLQERIAEKPVERKMWRMASHRLSIAATAAVLFLTVSVLFWMRENYRQQQAELAVSKAKGVEVNLKPEIAAAPPVDTIVGLQEPLADRKKLEEVLDKSLNKNSVAIARNKPRSAEVIEETPILANKETVRARLKKEAGPSAMMVGAPIPDPVPPVQALAGRVEGIQVQSSNGNSIRGVVLDNYGRPIPGANVKMVEKDLRAITNVNGEFTLPVDKGGEKVALEIASIGFNRKNVEAKSDEKLNVRLDEDTKSLGEVVVVTSAAAKKMSNAVTTELSQPVEGREAYEAYLEQHNQLFTTGSSTVELGFNIDKDGRPSAIKVLKGQTKEINAEAIRLLKEGPKWNYHAKGNNKGVIVIKF